MIQLGYFTLDTPDVDKARAFYAGLFGWRFDEASSSPTYAHVAGSDPAFGLTKGEHKTFPNLYFRVDDIHAACARVTELGGRAAVPAETPSGLSVVVSDDQGVSFSLWQPAPGY
ncbi:VOC family protein [Brevundimonas diminuta]|uniref:Bleomycin resistance protein n=1 Tax=Brevundimonas diminuta TaxID=293 RepID=A0A1Z3LU57_BREDI|nr:VOC family protein [Brevundimonas diminuta]ASD25754.1 bleomycin resistance protein [Brevundimonas diminuta]